MIGADGQHGGNVDVSAGLARGGDRRAVAESERGENPRRRAAEDARAGERKGAAGEIDGAVAAGVAAVAGDICRAGERTGGHRQIAGEDRGARERPAAAGTVENDVVKIGSVVVYGQAGGGA